MGCLHLGLFPTGGAGYELAKIIGADCILNARQPPIEISGDELQPQQHRHAGCGACIVQWFLRHYRALLIGVIVAGYGISAAVLCLLPLRGQRHHA